MPRYPESPNADLGRFIDATERAARKGKRFGQTPTQDRAAELQEAPKVPGGFGGEARRAGSDDLPDFPERVAAPDRPLPPATGATRYTQRLVDSERTARTAASDTRLQALEAATGLHITGHSVGRLIDPLPLALELAESLDPDDPVQRLIGHQIAALHTAGMQTLGRGMSDWSRQDAQAMLTSANRCFATVAKLVEAATRCRNGGTQQVVVKHVQVGDGGQAVIGTVNARRSATGGEDEN